MRMTGSERIPRGLWAVLLSTIVVLGYARPAAAQADSIPECAMLVDSGAERFRSGSFARQRADSILTRLFSAQEAGASFERRLARLCTDLGGPEAAATGRRLVPALDSIGWIVERYEAWRDTLETEAFRTWAGAQPPARVGSLVRSRQPVLPTAVLLLPAYRRADLTGAFLLTDTILDLLGQPGAPASVRIRPGTSARMLALFGDSETVRRMQALEASPPVGSIREIERDIERVFAAGEASADPPEVPEEPAGLPADMDARSVPPLLPWSEARSPEISMIDTPLGAVELEVSGAATASLTEGERAALGRITGRWFPDRPTFELAVRVSSGIGPATRPDALAALLEAARRPQPDDFSRTAGIRPLAWDGDGCGCGGSAAIPDRGAEISYGLMPFWAADSTQVVPFDRLTRIGYYGLTFDDRGLIRDSLHWKEERFPPRALPFRGSNFADFAVESHNHRTDVDLVLYRSDWLEWLPSDTTIAEERAAYERFSAALTNLIPGAVDRIAHRLSNPIDRIKPFIALGQSPRRSIGDGLTLHFDFSRVQPSDQEVLYEFMVDSTYAGAPSFFRALDDALEVADGSEEALILDLDLNFQLNLLVPGYCLFAAAGNEESCAFYSPEHLIALAPNIDNFIVDFAAQPLPLTGVSGAPADTLIARGRSLVEGLDRLSVEDQRLLAGKLIPLVLPDPEASITPFFQYVDAVSTGGGTWLGGREQESTLDAIVLALAPPATASDQLDLPRAGRWLVGHVVRPARQMEQTVCDFICPRRWWLRLGIFSGAILLGLFSLVAASNPAVRALASGSTFFVALLGFFAVCLATLWCDPWWSQQQGLILGVGVIAGFAFYAMGRVRLRRERDYP